ncbi:MAG: histidinol-phosphate transaminase [Fibrobacteres bacterium]|nr:histidinol-phosphate transaminase [Fibrobacterota bacterium]
MIPVRKAVERMKPYRPPLEGRRNFLRLDFNENTIGCSPKVIDALRSIDANEIATYPEYDELKIKASKFFGVGQENILPTNASDEGILSVFQTFLDAGSNIILPAPTFTMFRFYAELLDLNINQLLYNNDLTFPEERFLSAITDDIKALVVVNPNNPTGTPVKRETLIKLIEKMGNRLVLIDEAYYEFHGETVIDLINRYKNLVVLRTFSKSFGMAGLRLGTVISCKENVAHMTKAHSPYSISGITVKLAMAGMDDREYVERYAAEVKINREALRAKLEQCGLPVYPSSCNFLLIRFGGKAGKIAEAMRNEGILARDQSTSPLLEGCIRITVGNKEQTERVFAAIKKHL